MRLGILLLLGCLLSGCAPAPRHITLFSFYPSGTAQNLPAPVLLELIDSAPPYLSRDLLYRLSYADNQLHPYANSSWNAPPDSLLASELHHAGGANLLTLGESRQPARCALRVGITRFEQVFTDPGNSHAEVAVNFSLMQLRERLALKRDILQLKVAASTADARGGAQALETASRQAAEQIVKWTNDLLAPAASGTNPIRAACMP